MHPFFFALSRFSFFNVEQSRYIGPCQPTTIKHFSKGPIMTNLLVVGASINGDGDQDETLFRVNTMNEAIDSLIELIQEERENIEDTRKSDAHWKRIDCFKFFIGTLYNEMTLPTFECGSRGEILVEGVVLIVDHEHQIDAFDAIIEDLKKMKS